MRERSLPYILAKNDVVHFHIDQTYIFIELYDANVAYTYVRIFFYYFYWILNAKMTQAKHTYILQHIFLHLPSFLPNQIASFISALLLLFFCFHLHHRDFRIPFYVRPFFIYAKSNKPRDLKPACAKNFWLYRAFWNNLHGTFYAWAFVL